MNHCGVTKLETSAPSISYTSHSTGRRLPEARRRPPAVAILYEDRAVDKGIGYSFQQLMARGARPRHSILAGGSGEDFH